MDRSDGEEETSTEAGYAVDQTPEHHRWDGEEMIRKLFTAEFSKAADRAYEATLSTQRDDRERDRIPLAGWIVPRRVRLLWAHQDKQLPVGRVVDVRVVGDKLRGRVEFPPLGTYDFADTVERLVTTGFLEDLSVGFRVIDKPKPNDLGGYDFVGRHELLEVSVVNVPANVDARIDGQRDATAIRKWLGDDDDVVLELDDEPGFTLEQIASAYASVMQEHRHAAADPPVDPAMRQHVRDVMRGVIREAFGEIAREAARTTMAKLRGRVD